VVEQRPMSLDRSGERPHSNDVALDLDHLGDCAG
jgi:hypothetical protein